jgi:hypothetical protein
MSRKKEDPRMRKPWLRIAQLAERRQFVVGEIERQEIERINTPTKPLVAPRPRLIKKGSQREMPAPRLKAVVPALVERARVPIARCDNDCGMVFHSPSEWVRLDALVLCANCEARFRAAMQPKPRSRKRA